MSASIINICKSLVFLCLLCLLLHQCTTEAPFDPDQYYNLINQAELSICEEKHSEAIEYYQEAFKHTLKPFGKDAYNAALAAAISGEPGLRDAYLQLIVNNSNDLIYVRSQFVGRYMKPAEWDNLILSRQMDYDPDLRDEMAEINERDQLFRPDYDNYDDTINHIRIVNINRILDLRDAGGYPSHYELGYPSKLRSQPHDIVLHHSAQRRSRDKSVTDLEPILKKAIQQGRFDPEQAILYLRFQNDTEKGVFETYNTSQYRHPQLPDSLNSKIWIPRLSKEEIENANTIRSQWNANSIEDIMTKTSYVNQSVHPFIFSSVNMSVYRLSDDLPEDEVMLQYQAFTSMKKPYNPNGL